MNVISLQTHRFTRAPGLGVEILLSCFPANNDSIVPGW